MEGDVECLWRQSLDDRRLDHVIGSSSKWQFCFILNYNGRFVVCGRFGGAVLVHYQ